VVAVRKQEPSEEKLAEMTSSRRTMVSSSLYRAFQKSREADRRDDDVAADQPEPSAQQNQ
jgi:hypothetical protein